MTTLILVVDDHESARLGLQEMLKQHGYRVLAAASGKEALRFCEQEALDLVITDLAMPDLDGIELIRALHKSQSTLPILVMSGYSQEFLKIPKALGAVGALEKPVEPPVLLDKIREILDAAQEKKGGHPLSKPLSDNGGIKRQ
jgi:CheY-like chemotaxis protein